MLKAIKKGLSGIYRGDSSKLKEVKLALNRSCLNPFVNSLPVTTLNQHQNNSTTSG